MCILSLVPLCGSSQIKTPSFAMYNNCPDYFSQISYSAGWRQPTSGTCDYFNSCNENLWVDVPENYFGYQDNDIHAYAGLCAYLNGSDYKEYIGTKIPSLVVGSTYTISVTVSLADSSSFAVDGLGVLFTTLPYSFSSHTTISFVPQVDFSSYGPITDKTNWVTLTGSFVADMPYSHLIVGCFKNSLSVTIDSLNSMSSNSLFSYYYIGEIGMSDTTYFGDSTYYPPPDTTKSPQAPSRDTIKYIFPNSFTPNGDGTNDVFRIIGHPSNEYVGYMFRVYNRWGECVYSSSNPNSGWDGTQNGIPHNLGVYFYMCEFVLNSERVLLKGDVSLIR